MSILGAAAITAGAGLIGNIFGAFKQSDDAEKNREWQEKMAAQQNQWNIEQWQRENEYNDPSAQMARLKKAGINPNLAYSNGNIQNVAAHSPNMVGAAGTPVSTNYGAFIPSIGEMVSAGMQIEKAGAEIKLLESQAAKNRADAAGQNIQNEFLPKLLQGQLDLNGVQIETGKATASLTDEQKKLIAPTIDKLNQETENLKKTYDVLSAQVSNIEADTYKKKVDTFLNQASTRQQIALMASQMNLTNAQAREIVYTYMLRAKNIEADTLVKLGNYGVLDVTKDGLQFKLNQDRKYDDAQRIADVAQKGTASLNNVVSMFKP